MKLTKKKAMRIRLEKTFERDSSYEHNFLSFLPFIILVIGKIQNRLYIGWIYFTLVIEIDKTC